MDHLSYWLYVDFKNKWMAVSNDKASHRSGISAVISSHSQLQMELPSEKGGEPLTPIGCPEDSLINGIKAAGSSRRSRSEASVPSQLQRRSFTTQSVLFFSKD